MSTPTRPPAPSESVLPWSRPALVALVVAAAVLLVAVAAPGWAVRAALLGALALGVAACVLAVRAHRSLDEQRRSEAGERLLAVTREHGVRLREERRRNGEVVQTLRDRVVARDAAVAGLEVRVASGLRREAEQQRHLQELRIRLTTLRDRTDDQDETIATLRAALAVAELEAGAPRTGDGSPGATSTDDASTDDAELLALPRRTRPRADDTAAVVDRETLQTAYPSVDRGRDRRRA